MNENSLIIGKRREKGQREREGGSTGKGDKFEKVREKGRYYIERGGERENRA